MKYFALFLLLNGFAANAWAQKQVAQPHELLETAAICKLESGLRLQSVGEASSQTLKVLDAQGKILSEMPLRKIKYLDEARTMYQYTTAHLLQSTDKLQLILSEGQSNVLPDFEEGIRTVFALRPDGTWQKVSERPYKEKIIAR